MEIITSDQTHIILSKNIQNILTQKSHYFNCLVNGKWESCTRIEIPFDTTTFFMFQNYILTGNIPTYQYEEFIKICDYFIVHGFKTMESSELYKLSKEDIEIRTQEITIRRNLEDVDIKTLVLPDYDEIKTTDNYDTISHIKNCKILRHKTLGYLGFSENFYKEDTYVIKPIILKLLYDRIKHKYPTLPIVMGGSCALNLYKNMEEMDIQQDMDLFFITKDPKEALNSIKIVVDYIRDNYTNHIQYCRNSEIISLHMNGIGENTDIKINIKFILRLYDSIPEIITGMDIDATCIVYDKNIFYGNSRFLRCVREGVIYTDPIRNSKSYGKRLSKYMKRGYVIVIPGLDLKRMNKSHIHSEATGLSRVIYHLLSDVPEEDEDDYVKILSSHFMNWGDIMKDIYDRCMYKFVKLRGHMIGANDHQQIVKMNTIISNKYEYLFGQISNSIRVDRDVVFRDEENIEVLEEIVEYLGKFQFTTEMTDMVSFQCNNPSLVLTDVFDILYEKWFVDLYKIF